MSKRKEISRKHNKLENHNRKQYFFVIQELTGREIKRKYSRSKLGILWSVLNPLLTMTVLSLIFSQMFRRSIENYPVYYLCGYTIWSFFVTSTNSAMTSLVDNRMMLIKIKMPMDVFLLSRVYTAFVNFLYSMIAFVIVVAVLRIVPNWRLVLFPLIFGLLAMFSLGISYILACAFVFFGDIKHLWGVITTLWMYLSAIFYPLEALPDFMQMALALNPIFVFIDSFRHIVLWGNLPTNGEFIRMFFFGAGMFLFGKHIFDKNRNSIMQHL